MIQVLFGVAIGMLLGWLIPAPHYINVLIEKFKIDRAENRAKHAQATAVAAVKDAGEAMVEAGEAKITTTVIETK